MTASPTRSPTTRIDGGRGQRGSRWPRYRRVVAQWVLGHAHLSTTQLYLTPPEHADMTIKERALARTAPSAAGTTGRYRAPDTLLAFLDNI